jgi:hypothetical protein
MKDIFLFLKIKIEMRDEQLEYYVSKGRKKGYQMRISDRIKYQRWK